MQRRNASFGFPPLASLRASALHCCAAGAASVWREYKTPDGRSYYHNTQTNETAWTKPKVCTSKKAKLWERMCLLACACVRKYVCVCVCMRVCLLFISTHTHTHALLPFVLPQTAGGCRRWTRRRRQRRAPRKTNRRRSLKSTKQHLFPSSQSKTNPSLTLLSFLCVCMCVCFAVPCFSCRVTYETKEEAEAAFISLLEDKGISTSTNWDQVRSCALRSVMFWKFSSQHARHAHLTDTHRHTDTLMRTCPECR